jgi:hypothetical protein
MTYKNCKTLITAGRYEYESMFSMLDLFMMVERITQEEYIELTGLLAQPEEPIEPAAEETK